MVNLSQIYKLRDSLINNIVKKSILQGGIISSITIISYLLIVVFTTPNLPATASISAALQVNYPIIIGLAIGTGIQGFVISYRKKVIYNNKYEIKINKKKGFLYSSNTGNGLGAALSFIINIIYNSQIQFIIKGYPIYNDILYRISLT
jgi:hypothetical protein